MTVPKPLNPLQPGSDWRTATQAALDEAHTVELRRYQREEMVQARRETEKAAAGTVEANR